MPRGFIQMNFLVPPTGQKLACQGLNLKTLYVSNVILEHYCASTPVVFLFYCG